VLFSREPVQLALKVRSPTESLAKLTTPALPRIVRRRRLFRLLATARKWPIVWVAGQAGCGKTTLVAHFLQQTKARALWYQLDVGDGDVATFFHYMTLAGRRWARRSKRSLPRFAPEYLDGIEVFARRFFEELFARLPAGSALVLDNYQDLPPHSPVHRVIEAAFSALPKGVGVIVLSRSAPPAALRRFDAARVLRYVDAEPLRFTVAELGQLAKVQRGKRRLPSSDELGRLHARTGGWVAGAVLLLEHGGFGAEEPKSPVASPNAIHEYLASEVMGRLDTDTQKVLLRTSLLPTIRVETARKLSGVANAGDILARLHRDRYFTEKRPAGPLAYQYHPLFREFLAAEAKRRLRPTTLRRLQLAAARELEASALLEDAATLYCDAGRFDDLARLVTTHAASFLTAGRFTVIGAWLDALPPTLIEATPWLLYWRGACYLPFRPRESRRDFARAFEQFRRQRDLPGTLLAWSGVVTSIWYAWEALPDLDGWIDRLASLVSPASTYPSPDIEASVACAMFNALFWRRPSRDEIAPWATKVETILARARPLSLEHTVTAIALLNYYVQLGDVEHAERAVALMGTALAGDRVAPLADVGRYHGEAVIAAIQGDAERGRAAVARGLELAERYGATLWTVPLAGAACLCELSTGHLTAAKTYMDRMQAAGADGALVFRTWAISLRSRLTLQNGDTLAALQLAGASLRLTVDEGPFPEALSRLAVLHALHAAGRTRETTAHLTRVRAIERLMQSRLLEVSRRLTTALFAYDAGRAKTGLRELRAAMTVAARCGLVETQNAMPRIALARLCSYALEDGVEPEHVRAVIARRRLAPDAALVTERWPWPVRIYTLGRFAIQKDGKRAVVGRKVQTRTLDLLKVLVALGGREVSQQRVTEALWPSAEGDAAVAAMTMALKRLRELLGHGEAIVLAGRKLTIDARYCWVDAWALERALSAPPSDWTDLQRALALYRGPFLGSEELAVAYPLRIRLRERLLDRVRRVAERCEQQLDWRTAVDCYRQGLLVDDLSEELYQRLMLCHQRLGQRGEALATYQRCRQSLAAHAQAVPSAKTERVYRQVRGARS
jgi:ATP/maltotriose-dependent transcriptional regulator MalT/DNA-binding SARP family transcriptional activator